MKLQYLLLLALLGLLGRLNAVSTTGNGGGQECSNGDVQLISNDGRVTTDTGTGIAQYCNGQWKTVCGRNQFWNMITANAVCRQLGYLDNGGTTEEIDCETSASGESSTMCIEFAHNCDRLIQITCLQDECSRTDHGRLRLHDEEHTTNAVLGSVETCWCSSVSCRWLTICLDGWTNDRARYTCDNVELTYQGLWNATKIFYNSDPPSRSLNFSACTEYEFSECNDVPIQRCSTIAGVSCTKRETPYDNDNDGHQCKNSVITSTQISSCSQYPTPSLTTTTTRTTCSTKSGQLGTCTTNVTALGVLAGVLIAVLVAVGTGWVCTCFMQRRTAMSKTSLEHTHKAVRDEDNSQQLQRQLDNPVYDVDNHQPAPPANYSSLGPGYETVRDNEGAGHTYDVINCNQQRGRSVNQGEMNVPTSDHDYHVLEQNSHMTHNDEHDYHVLESNSSGPGGERGQQASTIQGGDHPDPQDYETPTPTIKPRGAGEDEEDYSRLKH